MIRCHQRAEICESGLSIFVAFFIKPSNIILENERDNDYAIFVQVKIEVLYKMVKKKILAVARCCMAIRVITRLLYLPGQSKFLKYDCNFFKSRS